MEEESLAETFDKYTLGKIAAREKRMGFLLKSNVPAVKAKLAKKYYDELVKVGFKKEDALAIICSGIMGL